MPFLLVALLYCRFLLLAFFLLNLCVEICLLCVPFVEVGRSCLLSRSRFDVRHPFPLSLYLQVPDEIREHGCQQTERNAPHCMNAFVTTYQKLCAFRQDAALVCT